MGLCGTLGMAGKQLLPGQYKEVFGSCGLQEESPQSGKITRRFTRLQALSYSICNSILLLPCLMLYYNIVSVFDVCLVSLHGD